MCRTVSFGGLALVLALAAPPARGQTPPAKAITFDDVLQLVKAGTPHDDVLKACETVFTFSPEESDRLRAAGATGKLIDALQNRKRIAVADVTDFLIILDCSGSMNDSTVPGQKTPTKMDAAKSAIDGLLQAIPAGRNVGLIIYGYDPTPDKSKGCKAVRVEHPLQPFDGKARLKLTQSVAGLRPAGHTPIALSLRKAGEELIKAQGMSQIVLITDGAETCEGPDAPAREAEELVKNLDRLRAVEVIGFKVKDEEKAAVERIARRGGGKFYDVDTKYPDDLKKAIQKATAVAIAPTGKANPAPQPEPVKLPEDKLPTDLPSDVQVLVDGLKSPKGGDRREAAKALGNMGEKAKPAVPALVARVADDVATEDSFTYLAGDPDSGCKSVALEALMKLAPEKVPGALLKARRSKNDLVKLASAIAFSALVADANSPDAAKPKDADVAQLVKGLVDDLKDRRGAFRRVAAESLGNLGEKAKPAVPALVARVADDVATENSFTYLAGDPNSGCKAVALDALKKVAPDNVKETLLKASKSRNALVRQWAFAKLGELDK